MAKNKPQKGTPSSPSPRTGKDTTVRKVVTTGKEQQTESAQVTAASFSSGQIAKGDALPFGKMNYILLGVGVALIALGFFLMSLDEFVDASKFSISLYIAPWLVVGGFAEIIYAIMYQPRTAEA